MHATTLGDGGSWVALCHGLFGQGKNWTQIAKVIAARHRVLLLDMPQHGRSPWLPDFAYLDAADLVAESLPDEPVALVGHSMGGKIAMVLALRHPERVERLCVVDVAPVGYRSEQEFGRYIEAMQALDLGHLDQRSDADRALADAVPDPTVRGFLLQNLRRGSRGSGDHDGWHWQPNLKVLGDRLDVITDWPADRLDGVAPYDGPVLWVRGERSSYVRDQDAAAMTALFPRARRVTVKGSGHWVHSEQPAAFTSVLQHFLGDDEVRVSSAGR